MEVTKENFEEILPQILEDIESCTFTSIDTELTGLWSKGEPHALCSQEDNYDLFLTSASNFICLQFGLTLFKMNPVTKSYSCKSYKFYIFPHQFSNNKYTFSCQASSIDFLASYKFDFNKVFLNGISYLNIEKEAELTEILEERRYFKEKNANREQEKIDVPEEHKVCINETCEKLASVLTEGAEEEVSVPGLNAYIRRLVYQEIKERYPNGEVLVETREGAMCGRKGNVEGHKPKSQLEIDEEVIVKKVGFSKVIKALSKSGKLVIGHNMFLDLCHTVHHFLCNAPSTYKEFKGLIRGIFPLVLDTKYMSSFEGMKDLISNNSLNRLYERTKEPPFSPADIDPVEGFCYDDGVNSYHDAGFDSYITGLSFISMFNYLAGSKDTEGNVNFKPNMEKISNFINRISLNSSPAIHINFGGADPEPDRSHYFLVNFPKDWVGHDIIKLFSPYGRSNINWINDTSAWVSLVDKSQADAAKSVLCSGFSRCPKGVSVSPYTPATYNAISLSRKRHHDDITGFSPRPKRRRSSRENSFSNKSIIKTIPEEEEDCEPVQSDKADHNISASSSKKREFRNSNSSLAEPELSESHDSTKSMNRCSAGSRSTPKRGKKSSDSISGSKRQISSFSQDDAVLVELEKDLEYDPINNPFSGTTNWEIS